MKLLKKLQSSLTFNIIVSIIILFLIFSTIIGIIGIISFQNILKNEYDKTTFQIAKTASILVNGDKIDEYLKTNGNTEDYIKTKNNLDLYRNSMSVTLLYVIKVDTSDYKSFVSVFNTVEKNSIYTEWEIGYKRSTTNEEYEKVYKDIYENNLEYGTIFRTNNLNGNEPHITTLVPIKNSLGKVVSILCIQRPIKEINDMKAPYFRSIVISTILLSFIVSTIISIYMRKQFVRPIKKIINETNRFSKENKSSKGLGQISKINDISNIAKSIDKMEHDIDNYIDNITTITSEKERISAELSVASLIQENSVPNNFPAFPERTDFDIYASMDPAKEVGGDLYDFFLIDDNHLAISIGDVSGKGIPAALFMMVSRILINETGRKGDNPAEILEYINKRLCEHNKADMFVTAWFGILELSTGRIIAANAGHEDPIVYRKNQTWEIINNKRNVVMGAMENSIYDNYEFYLNEGDKIFLYTDGVPEATDSNNNLFKIDRLLTELKKYDNCTPKDVLYGVKNDIKKFVGDAIQFDDLTMMCVELKNKNRNK